MEAIANQEIVMLAPAFGTLAGAAGPVLLGWIGISPR
jgi:hypothetical protein